MSNNNNNILIREAQQKLMEADPFLVEAISPKTVDELQEQLTKLQSQSTFVSRQSPEWYKMHLATIDVVESILLLRRMTDGDGGGVTLV